MESQKHIKRPESAQPIPPHAKCVFKGIIFEVYQWEQAMYDGSVRTFEKAKRPDTVIIFPVLPDGRILLTEQEQPGKTQTYLGATGGRVDAGEDVLEAALRELREESGYEAAELVLWDAQQPLTKLDWAVYTFIAKGLTKVGNPELDGGEKITEKPVTFDEMLDIAADSRFLEKEVATQMIQAKNDLAKREELRKLFS